MAMALRHGLLAAVVVDHPVAQLTQSNLITLVRLAVLPDLRLMAQAKSL
jgi:hypothetical protein